MAIDKDADALLVGGKVEADFGLANIPSQQRGGLTEAQLTRKLARNVDWQPKDDYAGPVKVEADFGLANLLDERNKEILTPDQRKNPQLRKQVKGKRGAIESLLDLNQGALSNVEGEFAEIMDPKTGKKTRQRVRAAGGTMAAEFLKNLVGGTRPAQVFGSIEDVQLSADQIERYNQLVEAGEINSDRLFRGPSIGGGRLGSFLGSLLPGSVPGPSGLTLKQAIDIVIDPNSPAPSRYDPNTGLEYHPGDIKRAVDFSTQYLMSQGLPMLNFQTFPNNTNLTRRLVPFSEATAGGNRSINDTGLRSLATLEELTLIAELVSGRSRATGNPRDVPGSMDDTLLRGNFLM